MEVRVSATVRRFIEGSGAYQQPDETRGDGDGDMVDLAYRICDETPADRRGIAHVVVDANEAGIIAEWADWLEGAARDDASFDNPDALADLNAARALLRQLEKLGGWTYHTRDDGRTVKVWVEKGEAA